MATPIQKDGHFRSSVILKGKRSIDPDTSIPLARLPPAVSSKDVPSPPTAEEGAISTYSDIPSASVNGDQPRPRQEDHYGFLYSMSESDQH